MCRTQITTQSGHTAGMERDMTVLPELDCSCVTLPHALFWEGLSASLSPLCAQRHVLSASSAAGKQPPVHLAENSRTWC